MNITTKEFETPNHSSITGVHVHPPEVKAYNVEEIDFDIEEKQMRDQMLLDSRIMVRNTLITKLVSQPRSILR